MNITSLKKLASMVLAVLMLLFSAGTSVIGRTGGTPITATRHTYDFDNNRLLIGGYNYDVDKNTDLTHISYVKDAGIDFLITPVNEPFLTLCDLAGIGVIASNYNAPYYYAAAGDNSAWMNLTAENYKKYHPCLWGDNLIDEPSAQYFSDLQTITSHYYARINGKLPLINLFPSYAGSEQLGITPDHKGVSTQALKVMPWLTSGYDESFNRYIKYISQYINTIDTDYISTDIYPLSFKVQSDGSVKKETNPQWLYNLGILAEACRDTNRDLWVITQASGLAKQTDGKSDVRYCDNDADIRWQMYTSLAFGTKAVIHACYNSGWWDTDSHLIDANGNRTATYYAVQTVDKEVSAFSKLYGSYTYTGTELYNGANAAGTNGGFFIPSLKSKESTCTVTSESPVLVGSFVSKTDNGSAYVVTNMSEPQLNESASATLSFAGDRKITVYRKGVAETTTGSSVTISLDSSEGVFVTAENLPQ